MNKSYTWKHSPKTFKKLLEESINWSDLATKCGYNCTSNFRTLKKRIKKEKLDSLHLDKYIRINNKVVNKKPIEELCIENGFSATSTIKNRLFKDLKWEHKCSNCNLTKWKSIRHDGKEIPIPLELDHINGNNKDHRLENLRLLCSNCHATTSTFKGRNKYCEKKPDNLCMDCNKVINRQSKRCKSCSAKIYNKRKVENRPTLEQLLNDKKNMSMLKIGKKYGVSDNCIRKWIKNYKENNKEKQ